PGHAASAITRDAALSYDATFAPDGRWVVFVSERSGRPHLHARNLGQPGADLALTSGPFFDGAPSFTPDGRSLVFVSDRDGNANIYRMPFRPGDPRAAGEARNLTRSRAGNFRPAVSPDGTSIAFSSDRDTGQAPPYQAEIYLMSLDGGQPRRLTTAGGMNRPPARSPAGGALFFHSGRDGGRFRIWRMSSAGTGAEPLSPRDVTALSPAAMAGGRVAFAAETSDGSRILSMAADGSDLRPEAGAPGCRGP